MALTFTGERFVPLAPGCTAGVNYEECTYEHWHRYAYAARLVEGKTVLDVASGEGYGAHLLAERASSVLGVDIAPGAVDHARATYVRDNLDFRQGSASALPVEGSKLFDVVVSFETIEHIDAESQISFLHEVRRVLKDDGVFIVSSPDKATYTDASGFVNEFHLKEFYCEEFREFLSRWFAHVSLIGQAVHGVSYLHPLDSGEGPFVQLWLRNSGNHDLPKHMYLVALCSNAGPVQTPFSVMLDAHENLLAEPRKEADLVRAELAGRDEQLGRVQRSLAEREAQVASLEVRLAALEGARQAELEAARARHAELEATSNARLAELEATNARLTELEATSNARQAELEAIKATLPFRVKAGLDGFSTRWLRRKTQ